MFADALPTAPETAEIMVADLNTLRAARQLPPVKLRADLACASHAWARQQRRAQSCGEAGDRPAFPERVRQCGGEILGGYELIACGAYDFRMATGMWLRDLSTASALLDRDVEFVGVGAAGAEGSALGTWYVLLLEIRKPLP